MRITAVLPLALLAACGTLANGPDDAMTVSQAHPITVDQQTVTLLVPADGSAGGLPRDVLARIDAFVTEYRRRGQGPITVTAPSGSGDDLAGQQTAADVRAALNGSGIPYERMRGATVRAGAQGDQILLSFSSYVATGPRCGLQPGEKLNQLGNRRSANFGCATQSNLAAMIADPRDLVAPVGSDGVSDDALVGAIDNRQAVASEIVTYEIENDGE